MIYFVTHPDVVVDPELPVPRWSLSERGRRRMRALLAQPWVAGIGSLYSSTEQKAIDGARILGEHLGLPFQQLPELGENDRSATGYLPGPEFEATADAFFARPSESVRGWETADAAQRRIVGAVDRIVRSKPAQESVAIVSHGAVGTLLLCRLNGWKIDRSHDQPGQGGGNYFVFAEGRAAREGWRPIDGAA